VVTPFPSKIEGRRGHRGGGPWVVAVLVATGGTRPHWLRV
jgi:hypothetical protein